MASLFNKVFVNKVKKQIEKDAIDRMDTIALLAHAKLVAITPKDIGQAAAGWNFTLNERDESIPPYIKRPKGTSGVLHTMPASVPNRYARKLGDSYHLSNFVEHTVYLNEGVPVGTRHSYKAPLNFIESEIAQTLEDVKRAGI